jgi:hypothetical protein
MIKQLIVKKLRKLVSKPNILTSPESLKAYSYDGTTNWIHEPDVVVFPTTTQDISQILKIASREKIPVTDKFGNLTAICPDCNVLMNRHVSLAKIEEFCGKVDISFRKDENTIMESAKPSVNGDFR